MANSKYYALLGLLICLASFDYVKAADKINIPCAPYSDGQSWQYSVSVEGMKSLIDTKVASVESSTISLLTKNTPGKFRGHQMPGSSSLEELMRKPSKIVLSSMKQTNSGQTSDVEFSMPQVICGQVEESYVVKSVTTAPGFETVMESLISHKSLGTIEVEVPAGVFTAHHFQSTREMKSKMKMKGVPEMPAMPATTIEQDIYVAKDIGLVKLVTKTPSINKTILSTQELISYSSGK